MEYSRYFQSIINKPNGFQVEAELIENWSRRNAIICRFQTVVRSDREQSYNMWKSTNLSSKTTISFRLLHNISSV